MFKKLSKKLLPLISIIVALLLITAVGITYAWQYIGSNEISLQLDSGSFILQYFHTGDGTEENPFVITRPIHYYHMVELYQRKASFAKGNLSSSGGEAYYFQIGYDLDGNPSNGLEVYNYDDTGAVVSDNQYSKTLNMAYYSGSLALLPMGTSNVPFIGSLDGSGLTVKNLHITATETVGTTVYGTSDVGIFGYIGGKYNTVNNAYEGGYVHDVYYENVTIDIGGLSNAIVNTGATTHEALTHSDHSDVYIGYLVGHLPVIRLDENGYDADSIFSNVYVNNVQVIGGSVTGNGSIQYGYIGHLDLLQYPDVVPATILQYIEYLQGGGSGSGAGAGGESGSNPGWGGSLDMKNFYTKMLTRKESVEGNIFTTATYVTEETVYVENGVVTRRVVDATARDGSLSDALRFRVYNDGVDNFEGAYYFYNALLDNWVCLSSSSTSHTKTVTYYRTSDDDQEALIFSHTTGSTKYYLSYNSSFAITDTTTLADASFFVWDEDANQGGIVTTSHNIYVTDSTNHTRYYLETDGKTVFLTPMSSKTSFTEWYVVENNSHMFYTIINNVRYYLVYGNDVFGNNIGWIVIPETGFIDVTNGTTHLALSGSTVTTATTTEASAKLMFVGGKLYTYNGSTITYLMLDSNGYVTTTTNEASATTFRYEGNVLRTTFNNASCVLVYGSNLFGVNQWIALPEGSLYTVKDGSNNLRLKTSSGQVTGIGVGTPATNWIYADQKIYTYHSTGIFYLQVNSNGFVVRTTSRSSASNFTLSANKITTTFEGNTCTLFYDSSLFYTNRWMVIQENLDFYQLSNGTYYINNNNGTLATSTTCSTSWVRTGDGKLYTQNENGRHYLALNANGILTISSSSSSAFTLSSNKVTVSFEGGNCILFYDTSIFGLNSWLAIPENGLYKINCNGNYLVLSSGALDKSTSASTTWVRSASGVLYTYSGTTRYYIGINSNAILTVGTTATSNSFTMGSSISTVFEDSKTYYLTYDSVIGLNKWIVCPNTCTDITNGITRLHNYGFEWFYNGSKLYRYTDSQVRVFLTANGVAVGTSNTYSDGANFTYDSTNKRFSTTGGYLVYAKDIFGSSCAYDWMILPAGQKITIQSGSVYLVLSGTTVVASTSESTGWWYSNSNVYTYSGTTAYYLNCIDTITASTTASGNWSVSGSALQYSGSTIKYYSQVGKWSKTQIYVVYAASYYMTNGTSGVTTSITSAQLFYVNGSRIYRLDANDSKRIIQSGTHGVDISDNDSYSSAKVQSDTTIMVPSSSFIIPDYYLGLYKGSTTWTFRTEKSNLVNKEVAKAVALTSATVTATTTNRYVYQGTSYTEKTSASSAVSYGNALKYSSVASTSISSATYTSVSYTISDRNTTFCTYTAAVFSNQGGTVVEVTPESYLITLVDAVITDQIEIRTEDSTNYTYIPIMTKTSATIDADLTSDYAASHNNTGYIISSYYNGTDLSKSAIRISEHNISGMSASLSSMAGSTFSSTDDAKLEILTRDPATGNIVRIKDAVVTNKTGTVVSSHNSTNANASNSVSSLSVKTVTELGLLGYQDLEGYYNTTTNAVEYRQFARDNLFNMLNGSSTLYGMRFMQSTVSEDSTINAKNVRLLGVDYDYYELPTNCVDFKVQNAGRISFFAGRWTTVEGSTGFFSLYKVFRNDDNSIDTIKEIKKIYKGDSGYLYFFADNTYYDGRNFYTASAPIAYYPNLVFESSWIDASSNISLINNAIYYFEIPVGAGEYALGSIAGENGAYLLYLDVGANSSTPNVPTEEEEDVSKPSSVISSDAVFSNLDYRVIGQINDMDAQGRHRSIMTFTYGLPTNTTEDNFSVTAVYQGEFESGKAPTDEDLNNKYNIATRDDYADSQVQTTDPDTGNPTTVTVEGIHTWCRGVYQIYIKNLTGQQFSLSVLLTDNDADLNNEFPYAYELFIYNSATGEYDVVWNVETNGDEEIYNGTLRRWSKTYLVGNGTITPTN